MEAHKQANIPLPVSLLLEQQAEYDSVVYLEYKDFVDSDSHTKAAITVESDLIDDKNMVTDEFTIPCKNLIEVMGDDAYEYSRVELNTCPPDALETLFNMVSIEYSFDGQQTKIGN